MWGNPIYAENVRGKEVRVKNKKYIKQMLGVGLLCVSILAVSACGKNETKDNTHLDATGNVQAQESTNGSQSQTQTDAGILAGSTYNPYEDTDIEPVSNFASPIEGREYGTVDTIQYTSSVTKKIKTAAVVLPAGYSTEKKYPVLYLLHGMGSDYHAWLDLGANYIVQNSHYENGTPDMIIVSPSVFTSPTKDKQDMDDFYHLSEDYDRFEQELEQDLMPYMETHYSILTGKDNTAVAGFSLGGRESSYIAFKHPDQFGYIGGFSATNGIFKQEVWAPVLLENYDFTKIKDNYRFILYQVGDEDPYIDGVWEFRDVLNSYDIENMYYETPGGHDGDVWQHGLYNFAKRVFR